VRVRDFVQDLAQVAAALPAPPVLVGHSMGGFVVQKYLEEHEAPAAVLLASVPPSGELPIMLRLVRDRPIDVLKANLKLSLWPIISDPRKAHSLLFSTRMPLAEAARFHRLLQDDSVLGFLDCLMFDLVRTKRVSSPILVMGADDDVLVAAKEVEATASAYNAKTTFFKHVAHDMMLDPGWRQWLTR
jgi:pimeloyl-ACP methyl ester carboxylesterase